MRVDRDRKYLAQSGATALRAAILTFVVLGPGLADAQSDLRYARQGQDQDSASAPLQTFLATVPEIVRLAIAEAQRDLTPDEALLLLSALEEFYQDFDRNPEWPNGSQAQSLPESPFAVANNIFGLVARLPSAIGTMTKFQSFCAHWPQNATQVERHAWARETFPRLAAMNATIEALNTTEVPRIRGVSREPLNLTVLLLRNWVASVFPDLFGCLPFDDYLFFAIVPDHVSPLGSVELYGAAFGGSVTRVEIRAPSLQYEIQLPILSSGTFYRKYPVALDAPLAIHTFTATIADLSATADLVVQKAPTTLDLTFPNRVKASTQFNLTARVDGPISDHFGKGPLRVMGGLDRTANLSQGLVRLQFVAPPSPGVLEGEVRYPGSPYHLPSSRPYRIRILLEQDYEKETGNGTGSKPDNSPPPNQPNNPKSPHRPPSSPAGFGFVPELFNWFLLIGPLVFVLFIVLQFLDQRFQRSRHATISSLQGPSEEFLRMGPWGSPNRPEFAGGIFATITNFLQWLLRGGRIRPHQTIREAAPLFRSYGANPWPVIHAFEKIRYGSYVESPRLRSLVPHWARRVWERMRGWRKTPWR